MGTLKIERIGGLAGFGLPDSRIQSSGEQAMSALSPADQALVEGLFEHRPDRQKSSAERDSFRYRLSREKEGQVQTVEIPESAVPQVLKDCVTDKLR
jgi:hypothetical protein